MSGFEIGMARLASKKQLDGIPGKYFFSGARVDCAGSSRPNCYQRDAVHFDDPDSCGRL
jgi:hypothetical protein